MRYHNNNGPRGRLLPRLALLIGALVLPLGACDTDALLQVNDPDIVTPGSLQGETGRAAIYAGAIGDFAVAYTGGAGGGSFLDGVVTTSAYFTDEAYLSGTFPTRTEFDQRDVDIENGTLAAVFRRLQFARRAAENAAQVLRDANATDNRVAETLALAGFTYIAAGENFCSGVPFSTALESGELEFGQPQTTSQIFQIAVQRFDDAIAQAGANKNIANLARVGKARALLNLGRFADAAQVVNGVDTNFRYLLNHSITSGRQENGFFAANESTRRLSIANDEGGSGAPFLTSPTSDGEGLSFLAENDPRVPFKTIKGAFDSTVPQTYVLTAYGPFGISLARNADSPLASGIEARLVEAEAALRGGGDFLAILNRLRAESALNLPPLTDPGTPAGRVDLLFKERAFWLFATGHRLGDLRRLIRQYNRTEDQVFPNGAYFKGGTYGDDVNLPIPFDEQNNPNFDRCIDRNA